MRNPAFLALAALATAQPNYAQNDQDEAAGETEPVSDFVGRYDGSGMEMAMGMVIREDGTFQWGLSVGALDMRAQGTWSEQDGIIAFVSDPKPVPPKFGWSGLERTPEGPLLRVVWSTNGEAFQYASLTATCSNGEIVRDNVSREGWSPPENCDAVETVLLREEIHDVVSEAYDLRSDMRPTEGDTIRFEFVPNDLGVADFSGMAGLLEDDVLKLDGGRWPLEMRKIIPRDPSAP